jgi:hypothetical protein
MCECAGIVAELITHVHDKDEDVRVSMQSALKDIGAEHTAMVLSSCMNFVLTQAKGNKVSRLTCQLRLDALSHTCMHGHVSWILTIVFKCLMSWLLSSMPRESMWTLNSQARWQCLVRTSLFTPRYASIVHQGRIGQELRCHLTSR